MNRSLSSLFHVLTHAYSGISRPMWIMAITMFINRSGAMVLLFMSVYLTKEKHFTVPQAGLVMGMFGAGSLVGAFVGGKLVDKVGYYPILIWSLVLSGFMLLILGQMQSYWLIAACTFMVTATGDMFRPANSAAITNYTNEASYSQSVALNRLAMNLGFTIGPFLGGLIASKSYELLFWIDGFTCIAAAIFIKLSLKKPDTVTYRENKKFNTGMSPYQDKTYLLFLLCTFLYAASFFQMLSITPLFYKNICRLNEKHIGWLMALNGFGVALIEMFLIYYIKNKWTPFKFIGLGAMLLIAGYLLLIPFQAVWALVCSMILITFSEMFAMPFMTAFSLERAAKGSMGAYSALYSMSWSLALIVSPLLGTFIVEHFGYNKLWIIMSGIAFLSFLGIRYLQENNFSADNQ